jgi:protein-S-isoprenylcysteine O-methyltransferase Ste14
MALLENFENQGRFLFKYRGHLPIIILLVGLLLYAYSEYNYSGPEKFWKDPYVFLCLGVCLLGFIIRVITVGYTPTNTSGKNTEEHMADELNTSCMYSLVRNPLYLGNFLLWLGAAMITANIWFIIAFILFFWIYYERIIFSEEVFLRAKFGDTYLRWAEQTPTFIPRIKKWSKSSWSFSWKKVLKKEKNSFAAIFVVFYLFKITGDISSKQPFEFVMDKWFFMFVGGVLTYVILKTIRRTTNLFHEDGR